MSSFPESDVSQLNDENKDEAIIRMYMDLYLTKDNSKPKYDFAFQPDISALH